MLALVRKHAPRALVLLVIGVVLARLAVDHPALATLGITAALLFGLARAAKPIRAYLDHTADSDRRTRAAMAAAGSRDAAAAQLATMSGAEFERHVAALLERDGCEDVRVTGKGGDRGADITAIDANGWRVVVQCKRYGPDHPVGDPEIQRFLGTVFSEHHADTALFVTTGRFTKAARELAGRRHVVLVDGDRLAVWMHEGTTPLPEDPVEDAV